jgi:hypothetical protein
MKTIAAIKYLMVLFLFSAMSCEEIVLDKAFTLGKESTFRKDELSTSSDGKYTLLITEIQDSRCPKGVQCIWQGEIIVKGEFTANGNKSTFEVHSVVKDQNKQPEGYTIQVIDAQPYPINGRENNPDNLIVTLLIKQNSKLDTITFAPSMKGWELYSWASGNDWKYSILMGTNRAKTYDEVVTNKIAVIGKDSLKMLLDKFPAKEEIFCTGKGTGEWANLSFPSQTTIDEITNYATQKALTLQVMK